MEHPYSQRTTSDVSRKCGTSMKMPNLPTYRVSSEFYLIRIINISYEDRSLRSYYDHITTIYLQLFNQYVSIVLDFALITTVQFVQSSRTCSSWLHNP